MTIRDITDDEFHEVVILAKTPVIVDFWAPWCAPCRQVSPILEEIAAMHPDVILVKVNIDENPRVAGGYSVTSVPTVIVFRNGEVARVITGAMSKIAYLRALLPHIS